MDAAADHQSPPSSPELSEFVSKLNELSTPEEKIAAGLSFMRQALSQEGSPRFRDFWEGRRLVLPIFKEAAGSAIRSELWNACVELTVEARRLKEILEEQSAFSMEQIDLAIQALETDLSRLSDLVEQGASLSLESSVILQEKEDIYNQVQKELNLLNALASRINSLRKEAIQTDMRIRFRAKFLKRLSEAGDKVFPRRKELIDEVSRQFEADVNEFAETHFKEGQVVGAPYFALREEIKTLQSIAKLLTLSSGAFNRTRLRLSECWDVIRGVEKEYKKEVAEKRAASSEKRGEIEKKIGELGLKAGELTLRQVDDALFSLSKEMREIDLSRDDVRFLKEEMGKVRAPLAALDEERRRAAEEAEKDRVRQKRERADAVRNRIEAFKTSDHRAEDLAEIEKDLDALELPKLEKQQIERKLRPLRDLVEEKRERELLNLSDDQKQSLDTLRTLLKQKKEKRSEIKEQIDQHRKLLGGSSLDFEKALSYRELVDSEKERLQKVEESIDEIEQKISEIEG